MWFYSRKRDAVAQGAVDTYSPGESSAIDALVARGYEDKDGDQVLAYAAMSGRADVVVYLLSLHGKSVGAGHANIIGNTAAIYAGAAGHTEVVNMLKDYARGDENEDGYTACVWAALHGHLDTVRLLVEDAGADVNHANRKGFTSLICASMNNHRHVVSFLLSRNEIDINHANIHGATVLLFEVQRAESLGLVRRLVLEMGADPHHRNVSGQSALDLAARAGNTEVVAFLESLGGSTTDTTANSNTSSNRS